MALLVFRVVHALLAALFVLSMAVQYNDPDPLPWVLVYGAAAVLAVLGARARPALGASVALLLLAGVWGLTLAPAVPHFLAGDVAATRFTMKTGDAVEEDAREAGGLAIVVVSSLLLIVDANGRRRRSPPRGTPA